MQKVGCFLEASIKYLGSAGVVMAASSIIIAVLLVTLNVFLRYVFDKPLMFADEFGGYMYLITAYMGLAYTTRVGAHVKVKLVVNRFPKKVRGSLDIVTSIVALGCIGVYFWFAWDLCISSLRLGQRADTILMTPLWIPQVFMWVGLLFCGLEIAARIVHRKVDSLNGSEK